MREQRKPRGRFFACAVFFITRSFLFLIFLSMARFHAFAAEDADLLRFRETLRALSAKSDFTNYFHLLYTRATNDASYSPYYDAFAIADSDAIVMAFESVFLSHATNNDAALRKQKTIAAENAYASRIAYDTLYALLTDKGYFSNAARIMTEHFSKSPVFSDESVKLRLQHFYTYEEYARYLSLYALLQTEAARYDEYVYAGHAAFSLREYKMARVFYENDAARRGYETDLALHDRAIMAFREGRYDETKTALRALSSEGRRAYSDVPYYEGMANALSLPPARPNDSSLFARGAYALLTENFTNAGTFFEQAARVFPHTKESAHALRMFDVLTHPMISDAALKQLLPFFRAAFAENENALTKELLAILLLDNIPEETKTLFAAVYLTSIEKNALARVREILYGYTRAATPSIATSARYLVGRLFLAEGKMEEGKEALKAYLIEAPNGLFAYEARQYIQ